MIEYNHMDRDKTNIVILGSTGSIGQQAVDIVHNFPDRFKVLGIAGGENNDLLSAQVTSLQPEYTCAKSHKGLPNKTRIISMEEMASLLKKIFKANTESAPRLQEIGLMTSQQSTASEQMADTVGKVREIAKQSSSSAKQLQSSINEIEDIVAQLQSRIDDETGDDA